MCVCGRARVCVCVFAYMHLFTDLCGWIDRLEKTLDIGFINNSKLSRETSAETLEYKINGDNSCVLVPPPPAARARVYVCMCACACVSACACVCLCARACEHVDFYPNILLSFRFIQFVSPAIYTLLPVHPAFNSRSGGGDLNLLFWSISQGSSFLLVSGAFGFFPREGQHRAYLYMAKLLMEKP